MKDPADLIQYERQCPRCKAVKPITDFPKNRSKITGRGSYCRPCAADVRDAYRSTDRGRAAVRASQRRSTERRKAAFDAAVAALPPEDRERLGVA